MATRIDELLRSAAHQNSVTGGVLDGTRVAATAGTNRGLLSASQAERDYRTLDLPDLVAKYGIDGVNAMTTGVHQGYNTLNSLASFGSSRGTGQTLWDSTTGVAGGFVGSLANLGALGVGLIDEEAGALASQGIQSGMDWLQSHQSDEINAARRLQELRTAPDKDDNRVRMEREIAAGDDDFTAGLRRWGRDTVDSFTSTVSNPATFGQGTSEAVGSLLAGGPIAKGLKAIGTPIMAAARGSGVLARTAATGADDTAAILSSLRQGDSLIGAVGTGRIARAGERAAWPAAMVGLETGGAYTSTAGEVMDTPIAQLSQSPVFQELIKPVEQGGEGLSEGQARTRIANDAGLRAALYTAPGAFVAGQLSRWAETPFKAPTFGSRMTNILAKEPGEEFLQGTSAGVAQGLAVQQLADPSRQVTEGLGQQSGESLAYGFSAAGAVQGPGAPLQGTKAALKQAGKAGRAVAGIAADRADRILKAAEETTSAGRVAQTENAKNVAASLTTDGEAISNTIALTNAPKEQKTPAQDYISNLKSAMQFDPNTLEIPEGLVPSPELLNSVGTANNRIEAIYGVAAEMVRNQKKMTEPEQLALGTLLHNLMEPLNVLADSDLEVLDTLPEGVVKAIRSYQDTVDNYAKTPIVRDSLNMARTAIAETADTQAPLADTEVNTPAGQTKIQTAVMGANIAPDVGNPENIRIILNHDKAGRITLTPEQRHALNLSMNMILARQEQEKAVQASGVTPRDVVGKQVITGDDPKYKDAKSALQYVKGVRAAMRSGNPQVAQAIMGDFREFVEHMARKMTAMNEYTAALANGNPPDNVPYIAWDPVNKKKFQPKKGMYINIKNPQQGVVQAHQMAMEQNMLAKIYNALAETFPEMGVEPAEIVSLDPRLEGKVSDIVQQIKSGQFGRATQQKTSAKKKTEPVVSKKKTVVEDKPTTPKSPARLKADFDALVETGKAILRDGVYYVSDADATTNMAGTTADDTIYVNIAKSKKGLVAYLSDSPQKREMLKQMGVTAEQFASLFKSRKDLNRFLANHERSHLRNQDRKAYPRLPNGKFDLMHPKAIELETRATLDGLTKDQRAEFDSIVAENLLGKGEPESNLEKKANEARSSITGEFADADQVMASIANGGEVLLVHTRNGDTDTITATLDGEQVGSLSYEPATDVALDTQVEPEARKLGVARAMYRFAAEKGNFLLGREAKNGIAHSFTPEGQAMRARMDITKSTLSEVQERVDTQLTPEQQALVDQANALMQSETQIEEATTEIQDKKANKETPLQKRFPSLVTFVKNMFTQLFVEPKESLSRIKGMISPISELRTYFANETNLEEFLGKTPKGPIDDDVLAAYSDLLSNDPEILAVVKKFVKDGKVSKKELPYLQTAKAVAALMQRNLQKELNKKYSGGKTTREVFLSQGGEDGLHRSNRLKHLNLTQMTEDGNLVYNQELLEGVVLAGLHWAMIQGNSVPKRDSREKAALLGIPEEELASVNFGVMNSGLTTTEIVDSLIPLIKQYWGVRDPVNDDNGYADRNYLNGIPGSMALEFLRAMVDVGLVEKISVQNSESGRTAYLYRANIPDENLKKNPSLLGQMTLKNWKYPVYFGKDIPPVSKYKMNTQDVPNTPKDQAEIKVANSTSYFMDTTSYSMFTGVERTILHQVFGGGLVTDKMNKVNRETVEGRNTNIDAALDAMQALHVELSFEAGFNNQNIEDVEVHYDHNKTTVNRLQQLGGQTPQGNQVVRHIMLPTTTVVDMTNTDKQTLFTIALGQAFGIKVHNKHFPEIVNEVESKLKKLTPAIELMQKWLEDTSKPFDFLAAKQHFIDAGISADDVTPLAMHALREYTRLQGIPLKDRKTFKTNLYIEADGVVNGVTMAMLLMGIGEITPDQIKNLRKGGINFGSMKTMADLYDSEDMYKKAAIAGQQQVIWQEQRTKKNKQANSHQRDILFLAQNLLPGVSLETDEAGNISSIAFDRGIVKNPMTVTLYGSMPSGISNKLTNMLLERLYEMASEGEISPEIQTAMNNLMSGMLVIPADTRKGPFVDTDAAVRSVDFRDLVELKLSSSQFTQLRKNILTGLVNPLRSGMEATLGSQLMHSMMVLRRTMQVQSMFFEQAFAQAYDLRIAQRAKNDPTYRKGDSLSDTDIKKIYKDLADIAPWFNTGTQVLLANKFERLHDADSTAIRSLDESYRAQSSVMAPVNSGVSSLAYLNQSTGDAQMVQRAASSNDPSIRQALWTFDGVQLDLNNIRAASELLNEAVLDSAQTNIHRAALASYKAFLNSGYVKAILNGELPKGFLNDLAWALDVPVKPGQSPDAEALLEVIESIEPQLDQMSKEAEARHKAMATIAASSDQMASVGSPKMKSGVELDPGMSAEETAAVLNTVYLAELAKLNNKPIQVSEPIEGDESGATVVSGAEIPALVANMDLTQEQKDLVTQILPMIDEANLQVVMGDFIQVGQYILDNGLDVALVNNGNEVNGTMLIDGDTSKIFLLNQTGETLSHELVHIATVKKILAHYKGQTTEQISAAINNLEALMQQFLGLRTTGMTPEGAAALQTAKNLVRQYLQDGTPEGNAYALNEFMAWALTNKDLVAKLKKTRINDFVRKTLSAITDLLQSLFGSPKKDMYSNLLFNTGVLINPQITLNSEIARISLNHDSTASGIRTGKLIDNLQKKIYSYVNDSSIDMGEKLLRAQKQGAAVILGKQIVNDFQNVFNLDNDNAYALELTTAAMALHLETDSVALTQLQTLYSHVLANLVPESFMPANPVDEQSAYQDSVDKFNLITGKVGRKLDRENRSTILSTFIGLAHVSPEFQQVLRNMPLPKNEKGGTFDQKLGNFVETGLDKAGAFIAGQGNSQNTNEAIARLAQRAFDATLAQENLVRKVDGSLNHIIDRGDQILLEKINSLSNSIQRVGISMGKSGNVLVRAAGKTAAVLAQNATEEGASAQADFVVSMANRAKVPSSLSRLLSDFIGRTESNAHIVDKIKQLRAIIQQARQHFRVDVPAEINRQFKNPLTERQWEEMFTGVAKSDFVSLMDLVPKADIAKLLNTKFRKDTIASLENLIQREDPANWQAMQSKMKQLAAWMNGGPANANLLVNAQAIAHLLNHGRKGQKPSQELIQMVDQLTSLYALDGQKDSVIASLAQLFKNEPEGMNIVLSYLKETRDDELKKSQGTNAKFNAPKGFVPSENEMGKSLRIVKQSEILKYRDLGYTELGPYTGSQLDSTKERRVYMFTTVPTRAAVAQGVMQNIHQTASGVDPRTGLFMGVTGGAIFGRSEVNQINRRISNDRGGAESLRPVFDKKGKVIGYERMLSPDKLSKLNPNKQLDRMLGVWRGRQFEEAMALQANQQLVDSTQDEYANASIAEKEEYVNLMDHSSLDPVLRDMTDLFSEDILKHIKDKHSNEFWVRRDLVEDVTGYRQPSVSDFWTGISRWSPETQKGVRDLMISLFGPNIFKRLVKLEQALQGLVGDARTMIVIKSGIVPVLNFLSNIAHLLTYMPITEIMRSMPRKLTELRQYNKSLSRKVQLEVLIRGSRNEPAKLARLRAEMRSIKDSHTRMSIWPLIQAGEYSTVADVGDSKTTLELSQGQLGNWIDSKVNKLPNAVGTPLKYLMVSKDTALFRGLQKSVQYGDFLGKAVLYDHLMKSRKKTREQALGIISDEFVNYDRLPGRWRGGLENFGALWFYNFKLRMVKVAASSLRNRPLRTLLVSQLPVVDGADMPGSDTIINKILEDTWHYSVGPGMGMRAPFLNPWYQLAD